VETQPIRNPTSKKKKQGNQTPMNSRIPLGNITTINNEIINK
jgi:hypothetical protein